MKRLTLVLFLLASFFQTKNVSNAQGFGVYGANRRVRSPQGFGGVSQSFTEPVIGNITQQFVAIAPINNPCGGSGTINIRAKYKDVPQMYLGILLPKGTQTPFEVDAGITWSAHKSLSVVSNSRIDTTDNPGSKWTVFLRVLGVNNGCYIPLNNRPEWNKGNLGNVQIRVLLLDEGVGFAVKPEGATTSLRWIQPYPPGANKYLLATSAQAKRVVAMTQQTRPDYDGSYMRGATASEGWLWSLVEDSTGARIAPTLGGVYRWSQVGGDASFFDPPGRYGGIPLSQSKSVPLVIYTAPPYDRNIENGVQKKPDAKYFREETVSIEMFPAVKAKGTKVTNR